MWPMRAEQVDIQGTEAKLFQAKRHACRLSGRGGGQMLPGHQRGQHIDRRGRLAFPGSPTPLDQDIQGSLSPAGGALLLFKEWKRDLEKELIPIGTTPWHACRKRRGHSFAQFGFRRFIEPQLQARPDIIAQLGTNLCPAVGRDNQVYSIGQAAGNNLDQLWLQLIEFLKKLREVVDQ